MRALTKGFPASGVLLLIAAACSLPLIFTPTVHVIIAPGEMRAETGKAYIVPIPSGTYGLFAVVSDDNDAPSRSTLTVSENGRALGPAHALHDVIRRDGAGAYSHWLGLLRFSASDGSDPRTNGRSYEARAEARLPYLAEIALLLIMAACLAAVARDVQRRFGAVLWRQARRKLIAPAIGIMQALSALPRRVAQSAMRLASRMPHAARLWTNPAVLALLAIACALALFVTPRLDVTIAPQQIHHDSGKVHVAPMPPGAYGLYAAPSDDVDAPARSRLVLYENGRPLGPSHAAHEVIRRDGAGAYSHWRGQLYFSASDGSDPRTNGRTYAARAETRLHWLVEIALVCALAACLGALARVLHRRLGGERVARWMRPVLETALTPLSLAIGTTLLALAVACLCGLQYRTHDDVLARMIAEGTLGDASQREFIILQNVIVGLLLRAAYDWLPAVPWYDIELMGACIAGALLCQAAVFRLCTSRAELVFCAATALLFFIPIFQAMQFTAAAMLLSGGALLTFASIWLRLPHTRVRLWLACASLVLAFLAGALVRYTAALLVLVTILPIVTLIGWRRPDRSLLLPTAAVGCAVAAAVLSNQFEAEYFRRSAGWESYLSDSELRRTVTEWAHLDRSRQSDFQNALAASGWTDNDYRMLSGWLFADRQLFSPERMTAFNELAPRLPITARIDGMREVLSRPESRFWLFAAVCFGPFLLRRSAHALAGATVTIVWTVAALVTAGVLFKTDLLHITWPLYSIAALAGAAMTFARADGRPADRRSSFGREAIPDIVFVAMVFAIASTISDAFSRSASVHAARGHVASDIANWPVRAGDTVVVWDNNFPFLDWARPFQSVPTTSWRFLHTFAPSASPLTEPVYAAWGTSDIAWAMCNIPRVFRVDARLGYAEKHSEILATHLRERHGQPVEISVAFQGDALTLYACQPRSRQSSEMK